MGGLVPAGVTSVAGSRAGWSGESVGVFRAIWVELRGSNPHNYTQMLPTSA
jgi:hypothetical protein